MDIISHWLDILYFSVVDPFFRLLGKCLELFIVVPLDSIHAPPACKVAAAAVLTSLISINLRRRFRVTDKERHFKQVFTEKKEQQRQLELLSDWKSREALYRVTDKEIDEDFNTYLAGRYVAYVAIYLLPVFLMLHWTHVILPGSPFVIPLPSRPFGLDGISIQLLFLTVYLMGLLLFSTVLARYFPRKETLDHAPERKD